MKYLVLFFCFTNILLAQSFQLNNNELVLPSPILFKTGTDEILKESEASLEHVKKYLTEKSYISKLRIEGHTHSKGSQDLDQILTEKRAMAVAKWLIKNGIDCNRLISVGFGGTKPIEDNSTAEGRAMNVRISFINAELKGKAIGGMPLDGGGKVAGDPCSK